MDYFRINLSPTDTTHLEVVVERSSVVGEGSDVVTLPFDGNANNMTTIFLILENKALEEASYEPSYFSEDEKVWMREKELLDEERQDFSDTFQEKIGQMLYSSLFPENSAVRKLLQDAISTAQNNGKLLHLQIKADQGVGHLVPVFDYPWELLHDKEGYLAARGVAISRYIAFQKVPPPLPQVKQINVLLICSRAFDEENRLHELPEEGYEKVRKSLEEVEQGEFISLKVLEKATFSELGRYLTEHRGEEVPHVIHFDGHGLIGRRCINQSCKKVYPGVMQDSCTKCNARLAEPEGYLLFEDDEDARQAHYVSAETLVPELLFANLSGEGNQQQGVVLIVLSACQSGVSFGADSVFNGVAQSLIRAKIPAVVGMQFSVSVGGATKFADRFYRSLNQCETVLESLARSRVAMGFEDNQWYRPVLYLRSRDDEGGKMFTNDPVPDVEDKPPKASHDILDSAFQFHAEMLKKQSKLPAIYHLFDAGNVVGRTLCAYAARYLNTLEEVIQKFSSVLHAATSSELGDDLIKFRYSLITPLDASVTLFRKLANRLPAFANIDANSRVCRIRQDEMSKALRDLIEKLREVDIHIALYEALLDVKPVKLKTLYLKLGVSYKKDVQTDSHEMKISELVEYCKDNNTYQELIQEVLGEYPAG